MAGPLYLGFDLSTQQLKGIAVTSTLHVVAQAIIDFDADFGAKYGITKGVLTNEKEGEVFAPVAMWLEAIDLVLQRLKEKGLDFSRLRGISGAGMQHGSVYWSSEAEKILGSLDSKGTLLEQLSPTAFSHDMSPNWQDASTQAECDQFDAYLGAADVLAERTGSKAHHRFTGPQILRFHKKYPTAYEKTSRISLVSSFLASIFLGKVAPFDISDVCGMNLYDIKGGKWDEKLLSLATGDVGVPDLKSKLGEVREDGGGSMGSVSPYFVARYGFDPSCVIAPFTGDNPSTILALPLRSMDAMVSLGTSTTFLMSTPKYVPDPAYHFMNHPTTPGLYMFMLCYKNGGLAREHVRNALNEKLPSAPSKDKSWDRFNQLALSTPAAGQKSSKDPMKMGLYFPRPEIVPNIHAGTWRFEYEPSTKSLQETASHWELPDDDARAIVESQMLSLRLRSHNLVEPPQDGVPPQPRRIYLVGGGSQNEAIARIAGEVLGGVEGIYRLDVGGNACALGAAYKAVWSVERKNGETFEEMMKKRWREEEFVQKIDDGYRSDVFEVYGRAVHGFDAMERTVLKQES